MLKNKGLTPVPTENPVPGGASFRQLFPGGGNVAKFSDRWQWFIFPQSGIWDTYTSMSSQQRDGRVFDDLRERAEFYSIYWNYDSTTNPIIW